MPGRTYSAGNSYRYGFNGKENDNEVKGEGNLQDYGMRIYDPRVGKFLSVDPMTRKYPELTPYQFASNGPIAGVDLDGLENYHYSLLRDKEGKPFLRFDGVQEREPGFWQQLGMVFGKEYENSELNGPKIKGEYYTISSNDYAIGQYKRLSKEAFEKVKEQNFEPTPEQKQLQETAMFVGTAILAKGLFSSSSLYSKPSGTEELNPASKTDKQAIAANGSPQAAQANTCLLYTSPSPRD